jgi:hypothetical protein
MQGTRDVDVIMLFFEIFFSKKCFSNRLVQRWGCLAKLTGDFSDRQTAAAAAETEKNSIQGKDKQKEE